ncbi:unnamed protein product [Ranitomeya imitator]|uniref:Tc1-like transposase DDE domain-containing protein n=1 Tax=Ranitomeya imitator TaxID=111125 RepID=A0ABN9M7Q3_9NEOB|nr:unnamed protein product [Ranitomeya imitator]
MDNDPKHTAKTTQEFMSAKKWNILQWPSQSPDLNPIEHAFHLLKSRLKTERPTNKQDLKAAAVKAWQSIKKEETQRLVILAWLSFTLCMSASVLTLNTYTKTILEFKYRRRIFEKNVRECNPFLDSEMVRFLWEKYIFSVSGSLEDPLNWHKGIGSPVFVDIGSITDLPGAAKEVERSIEVEDDGEQC